MTADLSLFQQLVLTGQAEQYVRDLSPDEQYALLFDWRVWRRAAQAPPAGDWRTWMILAGRGFGKTRTGAEWVREEVREGRARRIALVGRTAADVRDTMIEGESGILACSPKAERPVYVGSKRRLTWPNGAYAIAYSAEEPDRLRGPNHDLAWADELAAWRYPDAWDQLMFGLRIGANPRALVTTTPRATRLVRSLAARDDVVITRGSTYDNVANLAPSFVEEMRTRYEGTRLGRQELHAEILEDVEGALWTDGMIDVSRIGTWDAMDPWASLFSFTADEAHRKDRRAWRTIIAVDPPGETAECGIVAITAPVNGAGGVDHAAVLGDASLEGRPEEWGRAVIEAARLWSADRIVVESNQGGDMTRATIHAVDPKVRVEKVTARGSKQSRAEPVSALYERGLVHHVGFLPRLEQQMTTWVPGEGRSPDRIDALVHGVTYLLPSKPSAKVRISAPVR